MFLARSASKGEKGNLALSSYIRRRTIEQSCRLNNDADIIPIVLDSDSHKKLINEIPLCNSVSEQQEFLLESLAMMSKNPGDTLILDNESDIVLACATSTNELYWHLESLRGRGLLEPLKKGSFPESPNFVTVSTDGWNAYEEYKRNSVNSRQTFVAMSFSEAMEPLYDDVIKPAIEAAGYYPCRVDKEIHGETIDAKIIAEIRKSHFLFADVTEQNRGVYFEAGFAKGIGIPVIWSVCEDEIGNVHFDTRQFRHILWSRNNLDKFQSDIKECIEAFISFGISPESIDDD